MQFSKIALFCFVTVGCVRPAIAQQTTLPTGTYTAGNRHIVVANKGDRTCYQGVSVPALENSITVGETTGSLALEQGVPIAEGWAEYGRNVALNLQGSTITVTHEGNPVGEYEFQGSDFLSSALPDILTKCLDSTGLFFESSPGYVVTMPKINSAFALAAASTSAPSSPLPSGIYYAQGTMNNNSRRELLNRDGKLCIKMVDGPPSPYGGREDVVISSISARNGELFVDAIDSKFEAYQGQALQELSSVGSQTTAAFIDGSRRAIWERSESTTAAQVGAALEQDEQMRACIESQAPYVHQMEGAIIYGRL